MKKMLMLASLLVMSLGVSPSFAAKNPFAPKKSSQPIQYYPVMVCVDAANTLSLNVFFSIKDLGQAGKSKRKVTALVRSLSHKTGQFPLVQIEGDLGRDSKHSLVFSSTFSVFFPLPAGGEKVLRLNISTDDLRKKAKVLTSPLSALDTNIQLTCATPR